MTETINTYDTDDIGASQSLVTLESFIGDVDGKTLGRETADDMFIDEGTVEASDAVTAINGLIFALERRDQSIKASADKITRLEHEVHELKRTRSEAEALARVEGYERGRRDCQEAIRSLIGIG